MAGSRATVHPVNGQPTLSRRHFLHAAGAVAVGGSLPRRAAGTQDDAYPPASAVTRGPKHHFFGYYDKCPWDATGRYLLAKQVDFFDRNPEPGEAVTVGMVDLKDDDRFIALDETQAWSWQQGTMLQWLGSASDREIVYNSVENGRYVAIVRDVHNGRTRTLPRPIYALSDDGRQAVTLDYDRLNRLRPGYGYMALPERHKEVAAPDDAGIYWMDVGSGRNRLILSLAWAAGHEPDERFEGAEHWFNHLQFNPSGTRFIFLHRWKAPEERRWFTRLYTAAPDGSDIRLLNDEGMVSHFDWRDDHTILAWTRTRDDDPHFYLIDDRTGEHTVFGKDVLTRDGHCSYSPDRRWVLNDTYPDRERMQTLMLYHPADNRRIDIGRFHQPPELRFTPYRCDLHPRWNRDGTQVCIDSTHENSRQMYAIDVSHITRA